MSGTSGFHHLGKSWQAKLRVAVAAASKEPKEEELSTTTITTTTTSILIVTATNSPQPAPMFQKDLLIAFCPSNWAVSTDLIWEQHMFACLLVCNSSKWSQQRRRRQRWQFVANFTVAATAEHMSALWGTLQWASERTTNVAPYWVRQRTRGPVLPLEPHVPRFSYSPFLLRRFQKCLKNAWNGEERESNEKEWERGKREREREREKGKKMAVVKAFISQLFIVFSVRVLELSLKLNLKRLHWVSLAHN